MSTFEKYRAIPENITAALVTVENMAEIARLCGGRVKEEGKSSDPTDVYRAVVVPTLKGNLEAKIGNYLAREDATGEYFVMQPDKFKGRYEKMGERNQLFHRGIPIDHHPDDLIRENQEYVRRAINESNDQIMEPPVQQNKQSSEFMIKRAVKQHFFGRPPRPNQGPDH